MWAKNNFEIIVSIFLFNVIRFIAVTMRTYHNSNLSGSSNPGVGEYSGYPMIPKSAHLLQGVSWIAFSLCLHPAHGQSLLSIIPSPFSRGHSHHIG